MSRYGLQTAKLSNVAFITVRVRHTFSTIFSTNFNTVDDLSTSP